MKIRIERHSTPLLAPLLLVLMAGPTADAADFVIEHVASNLDRPVYATAAPRDTERLFIVEQFTPGTKTGTIKILDLLEDTIAESPFLELSGLATSHEQGLLGLAFHPDYAGDEEGTVPANGFFYVYYVSSATPQGTSHVVRYQVSDDPNVADVSSAQIVLQFTQPAKNHNGGWIGFGPDGYLYITTGDGGDSNDQDSIAGRHTEPGGNAQDITQNWLGKILRVDVDGDDFPEDDLRNYAIPPDNPFVGNEGDDEIWAYGLRNPWRMSFDRETHDLYIGNVGQAAREEIDFQPAESTGGENYGWRLREGTIATPSGGVGGPPPAGHVEPIHDYVRSDGCSVTGGFVYRGPVASLQGHYVFGDYCDHEIWSFRFDGSDPADFDGTNYTDFATWSEDEDLELPNELEISGFGEDAHGNLYLLDVGLIDANGQLYRVPEPAAATAGLAALVGLSLLVHSRRRRRP